MIADLSRDTQAQDYDGQQGTHPFLLDLRPVQDGDFEAVLRRQLLRLLGEVTRGGHVARLHLEVAGKQVSGRDRVADAPPSLRFFLVRWFDHQLEGLDLGLRVLRLFLELGELPATLRGAFGHHLRQLGSAQPAARFLRDRQCERLGAKAARALGRNGRRSTHRAARDLGGFADANEQDALRFAAAVDEQGLVLLSFIVAAGDGALEAGIDE